MPVSPLYRNVCRPNICFANQLTGFYMRTKLTLNGLNTNENFFEVVCLDENGKTLNIFAYPSNN